MLHTITAFCFAFAPFVPVFVGLLLYRNLRNGA